MRKQKLKLITRINWEERKKVVKVENVLFNHHYM